MFKKYKLSMFGLLRHKETLKYEHPKYYDGLMPIAEEKPVPIPDEEEVLELDLSNPGDLWTWREMNKYTWGYYVGSNKIYYGEDCQITKVSGNKIYVEWYGEHLIGWTKEWKAGKWVYISEVVQYMDQKESKR